MRLTLPTDYVDRQCDVCWQWFAFEYVYVEFSERRGGLVVRRTAAEPCNHEPVKEEEEYA